MNLAPGTQVREYEIASVLGQGGTSTVYAAEHTILGTNHALKVLHSPAERIRSSLLREGRFQARLDPSLVVPVTDVIFIDGVPALVMPIVRGCNLRDLLAHHQPSQQEISTVMSAVAAGLASVHAAGIVHRDVKPANVLLDLHHGHLRTRLSDFGLARTDTDRNETRKGAFMGTLRYAAPEQLRDASSAELPADIWALGIILYQLLCGDTPFYADNIIDMVEKIQRKRLPLDDVPEPWRPLTAALLDFDPAQRPQADELVERIQTCCPARPITTGDALAETVTWLADRSRHARSPSRTRHLSEDINSMPPRGESTIDLNTFLPHQNTLLSNHFIPIERDPFVRRYVPMETLQQAISAQQRLVTLLGAGGTGKTRLAIHYGWMSLSSWPGGVWFCDLSESQDLDGILSAVAAPLGVPLSGADPTWLLGQAIDGRGTCLLILDNLEQVLDAARDVLVRWMQMAPESTFIVTSREHLGLRQETSLAVPPMTNEEALELFLSRASQNKPGYAPDQPTKVVVQELCTLLDRLPLAIELAAARTRVMSPQKMLVRMSERFRLLRGSGARTPRQSTLRATLDWSWNLLRDWEQSALAQLSIFEGGFELEDVEAVFCFDDTPDAPWALDVLQSLVDKSLLQPMGSDRFSLLLSVQEYAAEKLIDTRTEQRHGERFALMGTPEATQALHQHGGLERRQVLARNLANFTAACRRAIDRGDFTVAVCTMRAAWQVISHKGPYSSAWPLLNAILRMDGLPPELRAQAEAIEANITLRQGDRQRALQMYTALLEGLPPSGQEDLRGGYLLEIASIQATSGSTREAAENLERAQALFEATGNRGSEGWARYHQGRQLFIRSKLTEAQARYTQAINHFKHQGDLVGESYTLLCIGLIHFRQGEHRRGLEICNQSQALSRRLGDRIGTANALFNSSAAHFLYGRLHQALGQSTEALQIYQAIGHRTGQAWVHVNLCAIHCEHGRLDEAAHHSQEALSISRAAGSMRLEGCARFEVGRVHMLRGQLEAAQESTQTSARLFRGTHDRQGEATAQHLLGRIAAENGDLQEARTLYDTALATFEEIGEPWGRSMVLIDRGNVLIQTGAENEAMAGYQTALDIARNKYKRPWGAACGGMAHLLASTGEPEAARALLHEGAAVLRNASYLSLLIHFLSQAAMVHLCENNLEAARESISEAEDLFRSSVGSKASMPRILMRAQEQLQLHEHR